jgi:hypothetical protein
VAMQLDGRATNASFDCALDSARDDRGGLDWEAGHRDRYEESNLISSQARMPGEKVSYRGGETCWSRPRNFWTPWP